MKEVFLYRKVFVYYPKGKQSGGPEALHQLVDSLRRQGVDAFLVPYPQSIHKERVEQYSHYDAPESSRIEDTDDAAVVAGEGQYALLFRVRHAAVICWWLAIESSVLYQSLRLPYLRPYEAPRNRTIGFAKDRTIEAIGRFRRLSYRDDHFTHVTQSQYAWSFLADRKKTLPSMLSDFTPNQEFISSFSTAPTARHGVSFNATKAQHLTSEVAKACPNVDFIPIQNMTQTEVYAALGQSSVYLDLGAHPGKDRIPREAALTGCVVSVALRGAGAHTSDVPLPFEHKVRLDGDMTANARDTIEAILRDREIAFAKQASFRAKISAEKKTFDGETKAIFIEGLRGFDSPQSQALGSDYLIAPKNKKDSSPH